jgi:transposase
MGRRARQFSLSDADRAELERISRSRTEAKQRVERAKIILGCIDGEAQKLLAQRLGTRPTTISKWRGRFAKFGMKGLEDAPRSGKPKRHIGLREKVLKTLETPPPKGQARWDGLSLAAIVGAKKSSIYNILRKDGVHLHRKRSWCVSTDPEFAAKAGTSSAFVCSLRRERWFCRWMRSRAFTRFHERQVTCKPRAARSRR